MRHQKLNFRARLSAAQLSAAQVARVLVVFALSTFGLSACDWVDSTGRDNNSTPVIDIVLNDGQTAGPQLLDEETTASITVKGTDTDGSVRSWQWDASPVEQGNLAECGRVVGFTSELAVDSLQAACSSADDCQMQFELQSSDADTAVFLLRTPKLAAPVGLRYRLVATDNDGGVGSSEHAFCMMSVNNPPQPEDDTFTVLEGQLLNVTANDINLLSNDKDDTDDVKNKPLRVDTDAVTLPASADVFELREDGGFSYSFKGVNLVKNVTDRFEYSVSDGEYSVKAAVTINVVARNDDPIANGTIGALEEIAGIDFTLDFADFFSDPEGNTLGFSVLSGSFPRSGGIELSPIGVLSGAGEPIDVGDHEFTLLVSDGVARTTAEISLTIIDNEAVRVSALADQAIQENSTITLAVASRFTDPEAQELSYAIDSRESGVNLTITARTGVIAGFISAPGEYDVEVTADDGYNTPTLMIITFEVEAENDAPIFTGTIANQSIELGDDIKRIRPDFTDPEGDALTYRLQGLSPTGLTLNTKGELTGKPRQTGVFSGLRIVATDLGGLIARSNAFTISVER